MTKPRSTPTKPTIPHERAQARRFHVFKTIPPRSEHYLKRELNIPRRNTSTGSIGSDPAEVGVPGGRIAVHIPRILDVQSVEGFDSQLGAQPLPKRDILEQRHIRLAEGRIPDQPASGVAKRQDRHCERARVEPE